MVEQSFKLLSLKLGRMIATTSYFKAAAKILASIASMRVVASNREFGLPTLRTVQHRLVFGCRAHHAGESEVCCGSFASVWPRTEDFHSPPINRHRHRASACLKRANKRLMHRSNLTAYSIISSARASSDGETVNPSAFAVLRLTASRYFVGACAGRLAGFSPLKMRST